MQIVMTTRHPSEDYSSSSDESFELIDSPDDVIKSRNISSDGEKKNNDDVTSSEVAVTGVIDETALIDAQKSVAIGKGDDVEEQSNEEKSIDDVVVSSDEFERRRILEISADEKRAENGENIEEIEDMVALQDKLKTQDAMLTLRDAKVCELENEVMRLSELIDAHKDVEKYRKGIIEENTKEIIRMKKLLEKSSKDKEKLEVELRNEQCVTKMKEHDIELLKSVNKQYLMSNEETKEQDIEQLKNVNKQYLMANEKLQNGADKLHKELSTFTVECENKQDKEHFAIIGFSIFIVIILSTANFYLPQHTHASSIMIIAINVLLLYLITTIVDNGNMRARKIRDLVRKISSYCFAVATDVEIVPIKHFSNDQEARNNTKVHPITEAEKPEETDEDHEESSYSIERRAHASSNQPIKHSIYRIKRLRTVSESNDIYVSTVTLNKGEDGLFGFSLVGTSICSVEENSAAYKGGLMEGDEIVCINGVDSLSTKKIKKILNGCETVVLRVRYNIELLRDAKTTHKFQRAF